MVKTLYKILLCDRDEIAQPILMTLGVRQKITHWDGVSFHHRAPCIHTFTHSLLRQFNVDDTLKLMFLGVLRKVKKLDDTHMVSFGQEQTVDPGAGKRQCYLLPRFIHTKKISLITKLPRHSNKKKKKCKKESTTKCPISHCCWWAFV